MWHFMVPVMDDVTDVLLLAGTFGSGQEFLWWTCLCVLTVAEGDRLCVLLLLLVSTLWLVLMTVAWLCCSCFSVLAYREAEHVSVDDVLAIMESLLLGQEVDRRNAGSLFLDAVSWVVLGSRARSSDFMSALGLAGRGPARLEEENGRGLRAIDELIRHHPFRLLGELLFSCPYGHRIAGRGGDAARTAEAMTKAVGETLVVDTLFLALGVATSGWDGTFTGVAGASALFSILELVSELQYYVHHAVGYMDDIHAGSSEEFEWPPDEEDARERL